MLDECEAFADNSVMEAIHTPVLLDECLSLLSPESGQDQMADSTIGEGGHTMAFLKAYPQLHITGIDRDGEQIERASSRLSQYTGRVTLCNMWTDDYYAEAKRKGSKFDIILFDLGISMFHYALSGRGFSFRQDEALDMRLDKNEGRTAADLVNTLREEEIADILYNYGGERLSRRIARAICKARAKANITSSCALADIIYNSVPNAYRHSKIHCATRTFQAFRIAVNDELGRLERALSLSFDCLNDGGKMGVISFHSLEDGITKRFMRSKAFPSEGERLGVLITRKGVKATDEEVSLNPPSRSATLRVLQKGNADTKRFYEGQ